MDNWETTPQYSPRQTPTLIPCTGSTFTFLFQDENAGLEFGDRASGEFIPAIPRNDVLYMNIGDMFQRISNSKCNLST